MASGSSNVPTRAINALENANSQLRNACAFIQAPGVVLLIVRESHADDEMIAIATYGKLMVPISRETMKSGPAYHGPDGVFRPEKNTHVSMVIRLHRNGASTFFPNPYARHPISENAAFLAGGQRTSVRFVR
jgi:hypothetical protein